MITTKRRKPRLTLVVCVLAAVLALSGCTAAATEPAVEAAATLTVPDPTPAPAYRVMKVAHRGGAGLAPENTLLSFQTGLANNPDFVELDVHLSRDGELMAIHDPTVNRTTTARGEVVDYTAAELAALDASARYAGALASPGPHPVPTLGQVLDLVKGRAGVQIEIKVRADKQRYAGIEAKLLETLEAHGMLSQAVILSFDFPTLVEIERLRPDALTCALISTAYMESAGRAGPEKVAGDLAALGVDYAGVNHTWLTGPLLAALHGRGLQVGAWTVNEPDRMRELAAEGVAFITSDRPDLLAETLAQP